MGWAFLVPTGSLLQALAASNILPRPMLMHGADGHRRGVAVCCVLSLVINAIAYTSPAFGAALLDIAVACGIFPYIALFIVFYKVTIVKAATRQRGACRPPPPPPTHTY